MVKILGVLAAFQTLTSRIQVRKITTCQVPRLPCIVSAIKRGRMCWTAHIARMRKTLNASKKLVGTS